MDVEKKSTPGRWRRSARVLVVALASFALALSSWRAYCEVGPTGVMGVAQTADQHGSAGHDDGKLFLCCVDLEHSLSVSSVAPDASKWSGAPLPVEAFSFVPITRGFPVDRLRLAEAPPSSRSFYARSARVLR